MKTTVPAGVLDVLGATPEDTRGMPVEWGIDYGYRSGVMLEWSTRHHDGPVRHPRVWVMERMGLTGCRHDPIERKGLRIQVEAAASALLCILARNLDLPLKPGETPVWQLETDLSQGHPVPRWTLSTEDDQRWFEAVTGPADLDAPGLEGVIDPMAALAVVLIRAAWWADLAAEGEAQTAEDLADYNAERMVGIAASMIRRES